MELKELRKQVEENLKKIKNIGRVLWLSIKGWRNKRITKKDRKR